MREDPIEHVEVAIATPRGTWPTEGFFIAPAEQKVGWQLQHAARELHIDSTSGWIAKAGGREVDADASFEQNRLRGRVVIRYAPKKANRRR